MGESIQPELVAKTVDDMNRHWSQNIPLSRTRRFYLWKCEPDTRQRPRGKAPSEGCGWWNLKGPTKLTPRMASRKRRFEGTCEQCKLRLSIARKTVAEWPERQKEMAVQEKDLRNGTITIHDVYGPPDEEPPEPDYDDYHDGWEGSQ